MKGGMEDHGNTIIVELSGGSNFEYRAHHMVER